MKFALEFIGDTLDDKEDVLLFFKSHDLLSKIVDARYRIRNRVKHGDIGDSEQEFLEEVLEDLWIEDLM